MSNAAAICPPWPWVVPRPRAMYAVIHRKQKKKIKKNACVRGQHHLRAPGSRCGRRSTPLMHKANSNSVVGLGRRNTGIFLVDEVGRQRTRLIEIFFEGMGSSDNAHWRRRGL